MLESCLPATGPDSWVIALLVAIGVVLVVAGAIFVARSKARVALLLVPVAALTLVLAAPAQPSQAAAAAIPSFTIPGGWDWNNPDQTWDSGTPTSEQLEWLGLLDEIQENEDGVVVTTVVALVNNNDASENGTIDPSNVLIPVATGVASVDGDAVDDLIDSWDSLNIEMTVTVTFDYHDGCGKPLQTVVQWTGDLGFVA